MGPHLTFLFENHDTIRYQVLEMVRTERMVKDADIRHEVDTYNELLGARGELGATLLIELDDPVAARREAHAVARAAEAPLREARGRQEGVRHASTSARWATRASRRSST